MTKMFANYDNILEAKKDVHAVYEEINSTIDHIMNCYYSIFGCDYTLPLFYETGNGNYASIYSECSWKGNKSLQFKESIQNFFEHNNSSICSGNIKDYFKTKGENIDNFLLEAVNNYEVVDSSNSKSIDGTI